MNLACWFILTLSRPSSKVKVHSHVMGKCYFFGYGRTLRGVMTYFSDARYDVT